MSARNKPKKLFQNDWFNALLILIIFLLIKAYKYGWDDQHLEIPLLKSLIDNTLYRGDYYVESLKANFVTYFYPLLGCLITLDQIPEAYLILYLVTRYFLFFWIYKFWLFISNQRSYAFICALTFIFLGRVQEFLYRTFSHQEFALAIIVAGLYFFYKERFYLASCLLGIAANFHALYSLFAMTYMGVYLVWHWRRYGLTVLGKTVGSFLILSLPIVIWTLKKSVAAPLNATPDDSQLHWILLYKQACPQNFIFDGQIFSFIFLNFLTWLEAVQKYLLLIVLYIFNLLNNEKFRRDDKAHTIGLTVFIFLTTSYIFTYLIPTRFVVDLNLVRNIQFLFFVLTGYTTILILEKIKEKDLAIRYFTTTMFFFSAFNDFIALGGMGFLTFLFTLQKLFKKPKAMRRDIMIALNLLGLLFCFAMIVTTCFIVNYEIADIIIFLVVLLTPAFISFWNHYRRPAQFSVVPDMKSLFAVLLCALFIYHFYYRIHFSLLEQKGSGGWHVQRDWEDMQKYVQAHTPKDALVLAPYDMQMGGFRIFSERRVVFCERDCGIVGFDYNALLEWERRLKDLKSFKVLINEAIEPAIMAAIFKYRVDYIVFMRYYEPPTDSHAVYQSVYRNTFFSLYKILVTDD